MQSIQDFTRQQIFLKGEYLQTYKPYGEKGRIPIADFYAEGGYNLHLISDYSQTFHLYARLSAIRELSNRYLMWYLRDRGISAEVTKANCDEIHYWLKGKEYYAIGFKNIAGGFELRNKFSKLCIPPKDMSLIIPSR